ncbi:hypothetical protein JTE90_000591 [Oedothorax gibbosus]|uniref:Ribosomal RNA-processing protein 14/surfeit locus protein 6 C-terminal domain-containing protein n=1 Tax=Oedothorax gibbosus TaxID=931172 RepID=A0AAV6VXR2_9ARAC|nr:hypothetical protein JTE90_000591 [Oedothorax gibbosus]
MIESNSSNVYTGSKSGEILQEIVEENKFLLQLVDTIPAKVYFDHAIQEKLLSEKHKKMDEKAEGLKRSFENQMSMKEKHKRFKLDPHFQKSVSQIQQDLEDSKPQKNKKNGVLMSSPSLKRAANVEELRKRLHERINNLHSQRKFSENKVSKKKLRQKEKMKKKKEALVKVNEANMQANKALPKVKQPKAEPAPKYNTEGKIMYSKLDFSEDGLQEQKPKSEFAGKNKKKLLEKAEKKKEKLENLKTVNPEKAQSVEEKEKWKKAILKSENVKIKDDPQLLKKSIKREEKIKQKKGKAWKERIEETEGKKKARQEKRTKNIKQRKDDKLKSKLKRAKKKGRVITGV